MIDVDLVICTFHVVNRVSLYVFLLAHNSKRSKHTIGTNRDGGGRIHFNDQVNGTITRIISKLCKILGRRIYVILVCGVPSILGESCITFVFYPTFGIYR